MFTLVELQNGGIFYLLPELIFCPKMANAYENYLKSVNVNKNFQERPPGKYKEKLNYLKQLIREYVHVRNLTFVFTFLKPFL